MSPNQNFRNDNSSTNFMNYGDIISNKYSQFPIFNGKEFIKNPKTHSVDIQKNPNDLPNEMRLQIIDAKLRNLENKQLEENNDMLQFIRNGMIYKNQNSPIQNYIPTQEYSPVRKRKHNESHNYTQFHNRKQNKFDESDEEDM